MDHLIVLVVIIVVIAAIVWVLLAKCRKCKRGSKEDPINSIAVAEVQSLPEKILSADPSSLPTIVAEYLKNKHINNEVAREFMDVKQDIVTYSLDGGDAKPILDKIESRMNNADPTTFEHKYFLEACNMMKLVVATKKII